MHVRLFAKIFLAAVCAVLFWEIVVTGLHRTPILIEDVPLDRTYAEGDKFRHIFFSEGRTYFTINNDFFGTASVIDKNNEKKIIVLGDSFTQALEVPGDKNFVHLIDEHFSEWNIINGGAQGTGLAEQIVYKPIYEELDPKLYLIQINYDDFTDNSFKRSHRYFYVNNNGTLTIEQRDESSVGTVNKIKRNFPTIGFIFQRIQLSYVLAPKILKYVDKQLFSKQAGEDETIEEILSRDYLVEEQMQLLKQTYGDNFILVFIPDTPRIQENNLYLTSTYQQWTDDMFFYADQYDVPIIDLTENFHTYYEENNRFPFGFFDTQPGVGHLNSEGHALTAKAIIDYFEQNNVLEELP